MSGEGVKDGECAVIHEAADIMDEANRILIEENAALKAENAKLTVEVERLSDLIYTRNAVSPFQSFYDYPYFV